jgi:DNA processing protein
MEGISEITVKKYLNLYGTIDGVFDKSFDELIYAGFTDKQAQRVIDRKYDEKFIAILSEEAEKNNITIITIEDDLYPYILREIYVPPPVLFAMGNIEVLKNNCIAIVGSRNASVKGKEFAYKLAADLAQSGFTVVSGFAYGVDISAHLGAISKGYSIAVLGSGLLNIYPAAHKKYLKDFLEKGLLLSEFFLKEKPAPFNFPKRNRILSGLSSGVVIVEASHKSGSLITAKYALSQNREVFAVPAAPYFYNNATNKLIKQGAKLVENYMDIIEEFTNIIDMSKVVDKKEIDNNIQFDSEEKRLIFEVLKNAPLTIDELSGNFNLDISRLIVMLTEMEFDDLILMGQDNKFYIKEN